MWVAEGSVNTGVTKNLNLRFLIEHLKATPFGRCVKTSGQEEIALTSLIFTRKNNPGVIENVFLGSLINRQEDL